jgi:hypothetical protein
LIGLQIIKKVGVEKIKKRESKPLLFAYLREKLL